MDKSIDLGKLQNDLQKARALLSAASNEVDRACGAVTAAQRVLDRAGEKRKKAQSSVDTIQRTMLEAARTVANS